MEIYITYILYCISTGSKLVQSYGITTIIPDNLTSAINNATENTDVALERIFTNIRMVMSSFVFGVWVIFYHC